MLGWVCPIHHGVTSTWHELGTQQRSIEFGKLIVFGKWMNE